MTTLQNAIRRNYSSANRAGFSLLELFVLLVALFLVIIPLLLPSILSRREYARRTQCANNLKQLALATHNYSDYETTLPAGFLRSSGSSPASSGTSAQYCLLPYMEQAAFYCMLETHMSASGPQALNNYDGMQLGVLHCPSDDTIQSTSQGFFPTNYVTCWGDHIGDTALPDAKLFNRVHGDQKKDGIQSDGSLFRRGVFRFQHGITWGSIVDGTSNVALMSETIVSNADNPTLDVTVTPSMGTPDVASPEPCMHADAAAVKKSLRGANFVHGLPRHTGFTTILPPNAPSCVSDLSVSSPGAYTASSCHIDGVNVAMADGAVRFISNNIDCGDQFSPCAPIGPSPYGVWGALGTRSGGETIDL